ncbi:MAG: DNA primase [Desulfurococcales archaeon]|nr:DNA primase [Desulfurococcales archaeon]
MKYIVKFKIEIHGRVDRHDIIGAIFGQTEGLLGQEFDLRELQDKGRVGRIKVDIKHQGSKTVGEIEIPSNLSRPETAVIAAMIETIDKVGPYDANIQLIEIKDLRLEKLEKIVERAKNILNQWRESTPDTKEILKKIVTPEKAPEVIYYGDDRLPAGPDVDRSDTVIIVEGRADVINLMKYGIKNTIALEGAKEKIPDTIKGLAKKKTTIAFVDGDRGGELILKTLLSEVDIDYVARAPPGKEVEDLTGKEISRSLKDIIPADQMRKKLGIEKEEVVTEEKLEEKPVEEKQYIEAVEEEEEGPVEQEGAKQVAEEKVEEKKLGIETIAIPREVLDEINDLKGTLEAILYDSAWNEIIKVPVRDLYAALEKAEDEIFAIIMDGIITQRLLELADSKGIKIVVGVRTGKITVRPPGIQFFTFQDLT